MGYHRNLQFFSYAGLGVVSNVFEGSVGLGWVGLGWVGLVWVGLGWVGLGCVWSPANYRPLFKRRPDRVESIQTMLFRKIQNRGPKSRAKSAAGLG